MPKSLSALRPDDFEPHNGESFTLATHGTDCTLMLVAVEQLGTALREGGAFSLQFTSAPGPYWPQAIYPLSHPAFGTLDVFVVPLAPKDGSNRYEVIFT